MVLEQRRLTRTKRRSLRSVTAAARRRSATLLVIATVALTACGADEAPAHQGTTGPPGGLEAVPLVTLRSPAGHAVGAPLSIAVDAAGRYLVADGSDKQFRVFGADGGQQGTIGRPGPGPGEFTALQGGGLVGDSVFGYDIQGVRVSFFAPDGTYGRSLGLFSAGRPMPASVRGLGDSRFLLVGFPTGSHTRDLLTIVDREGRQETSFLNLRRYFTPENPHLIQSSVLYADGTDGVVFAALMGHDSIYAFDYAGRRLGAGALQLSNGGAPKTFRELIEGNGGSRMLADGGLITEGHETPVALVALDEHHAAIQTMVLEYDSNGRLDRTREGTVAVATLDRQAGTIQVSGHAPIRGALLGQHPDGGALLARYAGAEWEQLDVVRLVPRGGR